MYSQKSKSKRVKVDCSAVSEHEFGVNAHERRRLADVLFDGLTYVDGVRGLCTSTHARLNLSVAVSMENPGSCHPSGEM